MQQRLRRLPSRPIRLDPRLTSTRRQSPLGPGSVGPSRRRRQRAARRYLREEQPPGEVRAGGARAADCAGQPAVGGWED